MKYLIVIGWVAVAACERRGVDLVIVDGGEIACGDLTCSSLQFCDFQRNTCGAGSEIPGCYPWPPACPDGVTPPSPVCGCDGQVYENECAAHAARVDIGGNCPLPAGYFACGHAFCRLSDEICDQVLAGSDEGAVPRCAPVPLACAASASCGCLLSADQAQLGRCRGTLERWCSGTASTGLSLVCALPVR